MSVTNGSNGKSMNHCSNGQETNGLKLPAAFELSFFDNKVPGFLNSRLSRFLRSLVPRFLESWVLRFLHFLHPGGTCRLPVLQVNAASTDEFQKLLELHRGTIRRYVDYYGGVLVRPTTAGILQSAESFEAAVTTLHPNLAVNYPGGAPRKKVAEHVWTSTEFACYLPIAPHTELSYMPSVKPDYILFMSAIATDCGGETPVIDMAAVLQDLPESLRKKLEGQTAIVDFSFPSVKTMEFDIRAAGLPKFRAFPGWKATHGETKGQVEEKLNKVGQWVEWAGDDQERLHLCMTMPLTENHKGTSVWTGFFGHFLPCGMAMQAAFDLVYHDRSMRQILVVAFLVGVTAIQYVAMLVADIGGERLRRCLPARWPKFEMQRHSRPRLGRGGTITEWDLLQIYMAYQRNMIKFMWQAGDILFLDNRRLGHARLPFRGNRLTYTSFGSRWTGVQ